MATATQNGIIKSFATRRLMAEWRDYTLSPATIKQYINIQTLESNIFEWYGNLAPPTVHPYYSGCIFHFVFYFPDDYPKQPHSIELKTGFLNELDRTYGYPSEELKREFQTVMKQIYGMNSWAEYYRLTGQKPLSESELARQIYWDTKTSTRKGYNIGIKGIL